MVAMDILHRERFVASLYLLERTYAYSRQREIMFERTSETPMNEAVKGFARENSKLSAGEGDGCRSLWQIERGDFPLGKLCLL